VMYTDPSGHDAWWCEGNDSCHYNWLSDNTNTNEKDKLFDKYNAKVDENMPDKAKRAIMEAIYIAGSQFSKVPGVGGTPAEAFKAVYGLNDGDSFRFEFVESTCAIGGYTCWGYTPDENHIQIYQSYTGIWAGNEYTASTPFSTGLVLHELGHAFNQRLGGAPMAGLSGDLLTRPSIDHGFFAGHYVGQYSYSLDESEIFADMFIGWNVGRWGNNPLGDGRSKYMENMTNWVLSASNLP